MNINFTDLRDGLRKSINNSITEVELTELVKLSRIIIRSYLNNIRQSVTYLCQQQGLTINDLAYECIAEVFARDGDKKFYLFFFYFIFKKNPEKQNYLNQKKKNNKKPFLFIIFW